MFFKKKEKIKPVIDLQLGCFATNRITVDGKKVGYMYREEPDTSFPDSGWRFFAGDENDEYANNPDNIRVIDCFITTQTFYIPHTSIQPDVDLSFAEIESSPTNCPA